MKNEDIKKPVSERTDQSSNANGLKKQLDKKSLTTFNNSENISEKQASKFQQLELAGMPEIGTHGYFDNFKIPAYLKVVANTVPLGLANARTVSTLAKLLHLNERTFSAYTHILTAKYHLPLATITVGDNKGNYIPIDDNELAAFVAQAQARVDHSNERMHGVIAGYNLYKKVIQALANSQQEAS
ncbi:hypothetical protein [Oenococcus oeni]|uniref:hypothetical protein n=1 Tax=Oenococcus oeni TaxID=1247 RepID=UPI00050FFD5B|nr:hypothetical protein [Oenococcus oeni]KGI01061.1 hypothetical protein X293_07785 [Oenococcus oeni IOEB_C52]OIM22355.1 hypothetical protein ATX60_09895 [Oenococcus oeni]SYW20510.1 conserved hypothetical protein [Oenococcus oeni]